MKIGLSYSRCVRDIVDGVVDIGDVLVLITRTNFNPNIDDEWKSIWQGYGGGNGGASSIWSRPEWGAYPAAAEQKFRDVSIELYDSGRMHQPRQFGAHPSRLPHIWLEAVLPTESLDANPALKAAWQKFQTLAQLSGVELDENC